MPGNPVVLHVDEYRHFDDKHHERDAQENPQRGSVCVFQQGSRTKEHDDAEKRENPRPEEPFLVPVPDRKLIAEHADDHDDERQDHECGDNSHYASTP